MDPATCKSAKAPPSQFECSLPFGRGSLKGLDAKIAQSQTSLSGLFENGWMLVSLTRTGGHPSFVYAARCKDRGVVKVGSSDTPYQRTLSLAPFGQLTVEGLIMVDHDKKVSAERHAQWALIEYHARGEWFDAPRGEVERVFKETSKQIQFTSNGKLPRKNKILSAGEVSEMLQEGVGLLEIGALALDECPVTLEEKQRREHWRKKCEKDADTIWRLCLNLLFTRMGEGWSAEKIAKKCNLSVGAVLRMASRKRPQHNYIVNRLLSLRDAA